MSRQPKIAVIGGGTGSFTLLSELKNFTPHISAIINMSDSGGSTGELRDELGILPPGDIRQALAALSNTSNIRDWLNFRYGEKDGSFAGHTSGNIFIGGLEKQHKSFAKAIKAANQILNITGEVIPITLEKHDLVLTTKKGMFRGEHLISETYINDKDAVISHTPQVKLSGTASKAIAKSDIVVIAPGNVYSSLLPALAVKGVREVLADRKAKLVVVSNLITKPTQTDGWHVVDYVKQYERYLGEECIDFVIYNNRPPSAGLLRKYAADWEFPVNITKKRFKEIRAKPIGGDFVADTIYEQDPNDRITRTLIRHDAVKIGRKLMRIFYD